MIDTKELRAVVQEIGLNGVCPAEIIELLDRLEAAEEDRSNFIVEMGRLCAQCDALRAKIERMEQPESGFRERCTPAAPAGGSNRFPLYALPGAQPAQKAVAYLDLGVGGYMDIGTDLTDEQLASLPKGRHMLGIVGTYGVDGYVSAQPAPIIPEGWKPIPEKHPTFDLVDLRLADGSVLCGCVPQSDGDYWWNGPSGEVFIDPRYAPATHWRLAAAAPEAKP